MGQGLWFRCWLLRLLLSAFVYSCFTSMQGAFGHIRSPSHRDVSASASPVPVWPARAFEGTLPGVFPAGAVAHAFTRCYTVHVCCCFLSQHQSCTLTLFYITLLGVLCFCSGFCFVCACRSRWSPCMSHEALSGHTCNLPSFHRHPPLVRA